MSPPGPEKHVIGDMCVVMKHSYHSACWPSPEFEVASANSKEPPWPVCNVGGL